MSPHHYLPALIVAVIISVQCLCHASTVTWTPATTIAGDYDISTDGTLDRAYNFVRPDSSTGPFGTATVNGVTFESFGAPPSPQSITIGNTTVSASGGSNTVVGFNGLAGDNYPFSPPVPPFSKLSPDYQLLLSTAVYNDLGALTLVLDGLIPGQQYEVQIFVNDSRTASVSRTEEVMAGNTASLIYSATQVNGGLGQFIIGVFTADNSGSQSIHFPTGAPACCWASQINGFQLRKLTYPFVNVRPAGNGDMLVHFLGVLEQSNDLIRWASVDPTVSSPLRISAPLPNKMFFRARDN
jgi:hypothetical protein